MMRHAFDPNPTPAPTPTSIADGATSAERTSTLLMGLVFVACLVGSLIEGVRATANKSLFANDWLDHLDMIATVPLFVAGGAVVGGLAACVVADVCRWYAFRRGHVCCQSCGRRLVSTVDRCCFTTLR